MALDMVDRVERPFRQVDLDLMKQPGLQAGHSHGSGNGCGAETRFHGGSDRLVTRQFERDMERFGVDTGGAHRRLELGARAGAGLAQHPLGIGKLGELDPIRG